MEKLDGVLSALDVLSNKLDGPGSSILLNELARARNPMDTFSSQAETYILHSMTACHAYVMMFIHVCRTGQVRAMFFYILLLLN